MLWRALAVASLTASAASTAVAQEQAPYLVLAVRPGFPEVTRQAGLSGIVRLEFAVDSLGVPNPRSLRTLASSHPLFEAPAREAVGHWLFAPRRVDGRFVDARVQYTVRFTILADGSAACPEAAPGEVVVCASVVPPLRSVVY